MRGLYGIGLGLKIEIGVATWDTPIYESGWIKVFDVSIAGLERPYFVCIFELGPTSLLNLADVSLHSS